MQCSVIKKIAEIFLCPFVTYVCYKTDVTLETSLYKNTFYY